MDVYRIESDGPNDSTVTHYMTGADMATMRAACAALGMVTTGDWTDGTRGYSRAKCNINKLRTRGYLITSENPVTVAPAPAPTAKRTNRRNRPATQRQQEYLVSLGVKLESGMTVARASQLIDAAKGNYLGSIGGAYYDGSN